MILYANRVVFLSHFQKYELLEEIFCFPSVPHRDLALNAE